MEVTRPDRHIFPRFWRLTTLEIVLMTLAAACLGFMAALWLRGESAGSWIGMLVFAIAIATSLRRAWRRRQPGDRVMDD